MQEIYFDNEKYIVSRSAAKLLDCTTDYISKLARDGQIKARRVGRVWYINENQIKSFKNLVDEEKKQKNQNLILSDNLNWNPKMQKKLEFVVGISVLIGILFGLNIFASTFNVTNSLNRFTSNVSNSVPRPFISIIDYVKYFSPNTTDFSGKFIYRIEKGFFVTARSFNKGIENISKIGKQTSNSLESIASFSISQVNNSNINYDKQNPITNFISITGNSFERGIKNIFNFENYEKIFEKTSGGTANILNSIADVFYEIVHEPVKLVSDSKFFISVETSGLIGAVYESGESIAKAVYCNYGTLFGQESCDEKNYPIEIESPEKEDLSIDNDRPLPEKNYPKGVTIYSEKENSFYCLTVEESKPVAFEGKCN